MNNKQKELSRKNSQAESSKSLKQQQEFVYNPDFQKHIGKRTGNLYARVNPKQNYDGFPRFSEYQSHRNTESSSLAKQLENTNELSLYPPYLQPSAIQTIQNTRPIEPFPSKQSPIMNPLDSNSSSRVPEAHLPGFGQFGISSIKRRSSVARPSQVKSYRDLLNQLQSQEFKQFIFNQEEIEYIQTSAKKQKKQQKENKLMKKKKRQSRVSFKDNIVEHSARIYQIEQTAQINLAKQDKQILQKSNMKHQQNQQQVKLDGQDYEKKKERQDIKFEEQNRRKRQFQERQQLKKEQIIKEKQQQRQRERDEIRQKQKREKIQREKQKQKQKMQAFQQAQKKRQKQKQRQQKQEKDRQRRQEQRQKLELEQKKAQKIRQLEKKQEKQNRKRLKIDNQNPQEITSQKQSLKSSIVSSQQFNYNSNQQANEYTHSQNPSSAFKSKPQKQNKKKSSKPQNRRKKKEIRITQSPQTSQKQKQENTRQNRIQNKKESASTSNSTSQNIVDKKNKVRIKSKEKQMIRQPDEPKIQSQSQQQFGRYPKRMRIKPVQYWENQRVHYKGGRAIGIQRVLSLDIRDVLTLKQHFENIINLNLHTQDIQIQIMIPPKKVLQSKGFKEPYTKMLIRLAKSSHGNQPIYFDDGVRSQKIEPQQIIIVEPYRSFQITNSKKTTIFLQMKLQTN